MKIAINGFGRIGRLVLRAALARGLVGDKFDLVAINDPGGAAQAAHLLKYDSVHGRMQEEVEAGADFISVDGMKIPILGEREPEKLPWKKLGVDTVMECTGAFTDREGCSKHLAAGAQKVLLSAPAKKGGADVTIVPGVNEKAYDKKKHAIVSMGSCTTNCLAPVAKTLNDNFGIVEGFMTTCHAYTNDQRILDVGHKDPRRARAAAINIIPTTTGAAKAIGEVLPELKGKLDGLSLRVPIPCGSINDLSVTLAKPAAKEDINAALKKAATGPLKGILQYTEEPLVSSDIVGNPHSSIVDGLTTIAIGKSAKVLSWYDNEWGFSNRMVDMTVRIL
ncbi:D-erythrose-4-phosphate dehydrogenase [uncultured archaeon]|nr:D-erythrose-4-phosphate dehydrogenase [uncultured archaeon]